jgi:hypothetical protein
MVAFRFTSTNKEYKLRRVAPSGFATFCFRKTPAKRLILSAVVKNAARLNEIIVGGGKTRKAKT